MRRQWLMAFLLLAAGAVAGWNAARSQVKPPEPPAPGAASERPLDTLDWLVGDWVDADSDGTRAVEFSCQFAKNGSFLVRSFRVVSANEVKMSGMQVIAWDPAQETVRSWTYDSSGGFGEETWSQSGNRYTIRTKYTLPSGSVGSSLNTLTYVDENRCTWKSVSREIDGEFQPDVDEFVIVRKPDASEPKGEK